MGSVNNGRIGTLSIAGLDAIRVGIQSPSDAEAAASGALHIVAFPPPKGARRIAPGDVVTLDGAALRVISYRPSPTTRGLMLMQLGA